MIKRISAFLFGITLAISAYAGSETPFPADWQSWQSMNTALVTIGALPGCNADVSSLPLIYQETVETYCAVRPEGPGAVAILVKPSVLDIYKKRAGGFPDGSDMILHLKDLQILFVTGHKGGSDTYGAFKEDGTDITDADLDGILSANTCRVCHSGYSAFCVNGQCGTGQ